MFSGKKSDSTPEVNQLKIDLAKAQAREKALLVEREFWVEQGRMLQNQLQTWQAMYAALFDQLGRGVVTDQDIQNNLALAAQELRQPVAAVEAVRAMTAMLKQDTQGQYTGVHQDREPRLAARKNRNG